MDFGHSFARQCGYMHNPFVHESQDGGVDGIGGGGAKPSHEGAIYQRQNQK